MEANKYNGRGGRATERLESDDNDFPELSEAPDEVDYDTANMATDRVLLRN